MLVARGTIENRQAIVPIGFHPFIPQALGVQPSSVGFPIPVHEYRALVDTGAQRTCLCRKVIATEGLIHHSKKPIQNVHRVERHYLYWVNLSVLCERIDNLNEPPGEVTPYVLDRPLEVIDIADNYWFDAILGMDVLEKLDLRVDRDGAFSLRFT